MSFNTALIYMHELNIKNGPGTIFFMEGKKVRKVNGRAKGKTLAEGRLWKVSINPK
jgi:hypothetical protein